MSDREGSNGVSGHEIDDGEQTVSEAHRMTEPTIPGRVALISGGARGQGRSHAVALARRGVAVAVCDLCADVETIAYPLATPDDLAETARLVEAEGARCHHGIVDVRDLDAVKDFVAASEAALGPIDIAITSAGVTGYGAVADMEAAEWRDMIDINLTGTFNVMRAVSHGMRDRRSGRIVTVSSMMGRSASAGIPAYVASKWGVIGLSKSAALEMAGFGVTVNVVAPGNIRTPMIENDALYSLMRPDLEHPTLEDLRGPLGSLHPMDVPWLEPTEVTAAVLFLVSEGAAHISGTVIDINAGASGRFTA